MRNPVKYRPTMTALEGWEDTPVSNAMAWASDTFGLSEFCERSTSPLVRLTVYLWADCACCMFVRGIAVGFGLAAAVLALILTVWYLIA